MSLASILEDGRRDLLDAAASIAHTTPGKWSTLEILEHVVLAEQRHLGWIAGGAPNLTAPRKNTKKELRLFATIRNRSTKLEAPEPIRPRGRFRTLSAALEEFAAVRNQTIEFTQQKSQQDLYAIAVQHPHFGLINGVEMLHLIDGHSRRHAEQIREAIPAIKPFHRDPADLPSELAAAIEIDDDGDGIEDAHLCDLDRTNRKFDTLRIEGSLLERVRLADGQFGAIVCKDVRFVNCDLANVRAHRIAFKRVELIGCRLTGFRSAALDWQDVLIQNGDLSYAQIQRGKFRNCEFDACNLQETDIQDSDLNGSALRSCDLAKADLRGSKLRDTDLRKSNLEGLIVEAKDLFGTIVDPAQAMILSRLLGLQIR